jgi:hypothetical protein
MDHPARYAAQLLRLSVFPLLTSDEEVHVHVCLTCHPSALKLVAENVMSSMLPSS